MKTTNISDLALVAYLYSEGYFPLRLNQTNTKRTIFVFKETNKLKKKVDAFWGGKALVEPHEFMQVVKRIKSQIYSV